ncbi:MAG: DUF5916 domain-containing protein, partial [Bacteroidota bacterium]
MKQFALIPLLWLLTMAAALAQPASTKADSSRFVPNISPTLAVHRATGSITIDGDLDDDGWRDVQHATNFSETTPGDRIQPPFPTEAMITYDDENLYVAFIAHDDPSTIRASLHDRDEMWNEDMCGLILDTYGDAAWAYEIFTNAAGVQGDLRWTSGGDEDAKFDMVFTSRGKITSGGYHVEMAIPFSSLRFPERPVQNWKATFWRIRPRGSREESSWAGLDRENPCEFCQYGSITGIENVKPGGSLDLLPSLVGHQSAALSVADDPRSPFTQSGITASASLGARYAITPGIGVEATVNPDFSQVEADAAQINVNSTFAVTYPERRPFFQEGSDLFNTWFSIVNTRSINDPLAAAKLTGRTGGTSFAAISAYDRNTPVLLPFEEENIFIRGGKSLSNIIRARQALPENSFAGLMVTDRRFESGGSGTTFGIDGALRFLDNYTFLWQAVASRTAEGGSKSDSSQPALEGITFDHGRHTAALDGETFWGR